MNKKTAIILDDERPAISMMESLIKQDGRIDNIIKFNDAEVGLAFCLENDDIDIAFIDIEMPFINGIDFVRRLNDAGKNFLIVYTTAFSEYTKQAYDVNAVGYLNKPLSLENLSKLLDKFFTPKKAEVKKHLDVTVMGTCKVEYDGKKVTFRTKKSRELFYYLLNNQGNYVTTDKLLDAIWGKEQKNTRDLLYSNMHYCRKAFKDVGLTDIIENKLSSYRINKDLVNCDYYELMHLLSSEDAYNDSSTFDKIAKLTKGDYLATFYYDWSVERNHMIYNTIAKIYEKYKHKYNTHHTDIENILK